MLGPFPCDEHMSTKETAILTVQNVEKSFGARRVLSGVSFAVHAQDRIALLGINGSGKSTLLRMLAGDDSGVQAGTVDSREEGPDAGLITKRRGLHVEYVPQEPRLPEEATVQEALRAGLRAHAALHDELDTLGRSIERGEAVEVALERQAVLHERLDSLGGWDVEHELRGLAAALKLPPFTA